ncbi:MAG: hypothetical protein FWG04_02620 [Desulfovibrionaceae bacterium]|nr:hypothetical protein [Desulfovibrionaceae bacterium]
MNENNTSATGGFLRVSKAPGHTDIEDVLQAVIVGITGICGKLVRPRWQQSPPDEPSPQENWCAFGITRFDPHNFPAIQHHAEGYDEITDYATLTVLASFYGPLHMDFARAFRVGLHIMQNRKMLRDHDMAFIRAGSIVPVPALVSMQWRARADLTLTFQRMTRQRYAALNLQQVSGTLVSEHSQNDNVPLGCQACTHACWREA